MKVKLERHIGHVQLPFTGTDDMIPEAFWLVIAKKTKEAIAMFDDEEEAKAFMSKIEALDNLIHSK